VILRVGHAASPDLETKLKDHVGHVMGGIAVPAEIAFPQKPGIRRRTSEWLKGTATRTS